MDYKYEEALKRCKKEFNFNNLAYSHEEIKQRLERVFPELKESEEELMRKETISIIRQYSIICEREGDKCYTVDKVIAWLEKQGEQKPTWNEEDEEMTKCVLISLEFFENLGKDVTGHPHPNYFKVKHKIYPDSVRNWLKSLKERVQPQPKQDWSEDDKEMLDSAIAFVEHSAFTTIGKGKNNVISWLKSLKERMKGE